VAPRGQAPQAPLPMPKTLFGSTARFTTRQLEAGLGMHLRQEPLPNLPDAVTV
jgi:hypothetical protein